MKKLITIVMMAVFFISVTAVSFAQPTTKKPTQTQPQYGNTAKPAVSAKGRSMIRNDRPIPTGRSVYKNRRRPAPAPAPVAPAPTAPKAATTTKAATKSVEASRY